MLEASFNLSKKPYLKKTRLYGAGQVAESGNCFLYKHKLSSDPQDHVQGSYGACTCNPSAGERAEAKGMVASQPN